MWKRPLKTYGINVICMKNFNDWNDLKKNLDSLENHPLFQEREVWWCSVGVNIGSEIFGKSGLFT
jgi:hypothetical protein